MPVNRSSTSQQGDLSTEALSHKQAPAEIVGKRPQSFLENLLTGAFSSVVRDFDEIANFNMLVGDDVQVEMSPLVAPDLKVRVRQPTEHPTLRTIGVTPETQSLLSQAADFTLSAGLVPVSVTSDALIARLDSSCKNGHREGCLLMC